MEEHQKRGSELSANCVKFGYPLYLAVALVVLFAGHHAPSPPASTAALIVLRCRPMLFTADVIMGVLVVLLVARGLWDLFRE